MDLLIRRKERAGDSTISDLYVDMVRECYVLEDVVREPDTGRPTDPSQLNAWVASWKIPGQTAIPTGTYQVIIDRSPLFSQRATKNFFSKYNDHSVHIDIYTPHLLEVPGYAGIRIHPGVRALDTEGCLCPGRIHTVGEALVGESRLAMVPLLSKIEQALGMQRVDPPDSRMVEFLRHWAWGYKQVSTHDKVEITIESDFQVPVPFGS